MWHLQNGLCLPTAARGIRDVWKNYSALAEKKNLQNTPHVQWLRLMRPNHEFMRWMYGDAALLLHSRHAQSVYTSQYPALQNKPA